MNCSSPISIIYGGELSLKNDLDNKELSIIYYIKWMFIAFILIKHGKRRLEGRCHNLLYKKNISLCINIKLP
jgi:hypothetical protein